MFPSVSRRSKGSHDKRPSPFSSPHSNMQASPIAARRSSLEERRRPAAKFNHLVSPAAENRIEEEELDDEAVEEPDEDENEDEDGDGDGDINEDDAGETSPLLPIFSAAHLGMRSAYFGIDLEILTSVQTPYQFITSHTPYVYSLYLDARQLSRGTSYGHPKFHSSLSNLYSSKYETRTSPRPRCMR